MTNSNQNNNQKDPKRVEAGKKAAETRGDNVNQRSQGKSDDRRSK